MSAVMHPRPVVWADQKFDFPTSPSEMEAQLLHLSTFPSQLSITLESIPHDKFTVRHDEKWSIQEHLGHLLDLEELPSVRVQEILEEQPILSPADMTNRKTWERNYNEENMYDLCERFMARRAELVEQFRSVPEDQLLNRGFHLRLGRHMSILDLAYFHCQHDRYHHEVIMYLSTA